MDYWIGGVVGKISFSGTKRAFLWMGPVVTAQISKYEIFCKCAGGERNSVPESLSVYQ